MKKYMLILPLLAALAMVFVGCGDGGGGDIVGEVDQATFNAVTTSGDATKAFANGVITVTTGGTNDFDGIDLPRSLFTGTGDWLLTVTGKMTGAGSLKLCEAGGSYTGVGNPTGSLAAGASFTLTGTLNSSIANNKVRISSGVQNTATPSYKVTKITIQ